MSSHGYSGSNYDRWVERTDTSTLQKMKETFWTTKQAVIQKLGKKEDEHVVASDMELDTKLEVFKAIQISSMDLLRVIEKYQDRLCRLSQEENGTGRFLKTQSNVDKTRAGKMMAAVGKSQSFAAQQRLSLRVPLVRLYQEVETFRYRAISDTLMTINRMEGARTEYRGALLWMKAVSEELDPDMYKQLEKFRKVQGQVRKTKAKFDKLKLDVMQKVDLLAASRCNMFSHVLANYQSTLLHFWEKTSRTMTAVAESFKGYQYYEFNIIKELAEPSKKLAEDTSRSEPAERDTDDDFDPSKHDKCSENHTEEEPNTLQQRNSEAHSEQIFEPEPETEERLIAFEDEDEKGDEDKKQNGSLQNLYEDDGDENKQGKSFKEESSSPYLEFENELTESQKQDFDFSGKILSMANNLPLKTNRDQVPTDLLSEDLNLEPDDSEKDDMTILNEILNAPSTGEDDFSKEWQAVFGNTPLTAGTKYTPVESDQSSQSAEFMPSNLLDLNREMAGMSLKQDLTGMPMVPVDARGRGMGSGASNAPGDSPSHQSQPKPKPQSKKGQKSDMSAWFNLFADLDPLSNPDAIGKKENDMTDA